jgi:hypothetical protein
MGVSTVVLLALVLFLSLLHLVCGGIYVWTRWKEVAVGEPVGPSPKRSRRETPEANEE